MRLRLTLSLLCAFFVLSASIISAQPRREHDVDKLVAHEWGTFTSLQDENGREIPGINIDDETVPGFVHNLSPYVLQPTFLASPHWHRRMKGTPPGHPRVTMRLETPVIYFHLPDGMEEAEVDIRVDFVGGWLTEFFPKAKAKAPGLSKGRVFGDLHPETIGTLDWQRLRVGRKGTFPKTHEHVWTAPR